MRLESKFDIGDSVTIDLDHSVRGVVTRIEWLGVGMVRYEVSWFKDGANIEFAFFDEWRLSQAEPIREAAKR